MFMKHFTIHACWLFCLLSTALFAQPGNDQCANAIAVSVGSSVNGSNTGATTTNDPRPYCGSASGGFFGGGTIYANNGVWYKVTGTGNTITASTCSGTNFDVVLSVWASCGATNAITCDDSSCPNNTATGVDEAKLR